MSGVLVLIPAGNETSNHSLPFPHPFGYRRDKKEWLWVEISIYLWEEESEKVTTQ